MVNRLYKYRNKQAFTLVEIMVVFICIALLAGPIFMLLRSGSDSSLKGMMRIDTTLKARIILHQIYADLKMACFELPEEDADFSSAKIFTEKKESFPNILYSFQSFPIHKAYNEIFENPSNDIDYRIPSLITYKLEGDKPPFKLIREEKFNGKTTSKILTENINFFEIKELVMLAGGKTNYYYLITLQLVDVLHSSDLDGKKVGEKLRQNQKDVILADFYDVVYPEYFNALWNDKRLNRNWHTLIKPEG